MTTGSVIKTVHAEDNEGDELTFGLDMEGSAGHIPFSIDGEGNVRLEESLAGRVS